MSHWLNVKENTALFVRSHSDACEFVKLMMYFTDTIMMMSKYDDSGLVGCENINMYV